MKSFKKTFYRPNPRAKSVHEIQAAQSSISSGSRVSRKLVAIHFNEFGYARRLRFTGLHRFKAESAVLDGAVNRECHCRAKKISLPLVLANASAVQYPTQATEPLPA